MKTVKFEGHEVNSMMVDKLFVDSHFRDGWWEKKEGAPMDYSRADRDAHDGEKYEIGRLVASAGFPLSESGLILAVLSGVIPDVVAPEEST